MSIKTDKIEMPAECNKCFATQNLVESCEILSFLHLLDSISFKEFDDEWRAAHKDHRRLKYCPLKEEIN